MAALLAHRDFTILRAGVVIARTRHAEDAAFLCHTGHETVKYAGRVVWNATRETLFAPDEVDAFTEIVHTRITAHHAEHYAAQYGRADVAPARTGGR